MRLIDFYQDQCCNPVKLNDFLADIAISNVVKLHGFDEPLLILSSPKNYSEQDSSFILYSHSMHSCIVMPVNRNCLKEDTISFQDAIKLAEKQYAYGNVGYLFNSSLCIDALYKMTWSIGSTNIAKLINSGEAELIWTRKPIEKVKKKSRFKFKFKLNKFAAIILGLLITMIIISLAAGIADINKICFATTICFSMGTFLIWLKK